jgi:hypothetical protein
MPTKLAQSILLMGLFYASSIAIAKQAAVPQESGNAAAQQVPSSPSAGKALIYVYRPGNGTGAANHPLVFVNDLFWASLHNSEYVSHEVPAGTVVFSYLPKGTVTLTVFQIAGNLTKKPIEVLRTEVEAGKTYYFRWSYATWGSHFLKLEDEATGVKEMKKVHPAKE